MSDIFLFQTTEKQPSQQMSVLKTAISSQVSIPGAVGRTEVNKQRLLL